MTNPRARAEVRQAAARFARAERLERLVTCGHYIYDLRTPYDCDLEADHDGWHRARFGLVDEHGNRLDCVLSWSLDIARAGGHFR